MWRSCNPRHTERKRGVVTMTSMTSTPPTISATSARPARLVATMFRRGPAQRVLHLTWFAFFLTFVAWFNFAPFATTIAKEFGLSKGQLVTLGLCNLALT